MAQTANYGFEKPSTDKNVDEEFYQLQETLDLLDAILAALQSAVNGKSAVGHTHAISDIVNLAAELAAKMPANQTFKLDDLTDVDGADGAPNGYVLVKSALGWLPSSALAALGTHGHLISEITGLVDALAGKADAAATTAALDNRVRLDAAQSRTQAERGQARANIGADVLAGHRNKIINGNFEIWQRGLGAFTAAGYTADRWCLSNGAGASNSISRTLAAAAYPDAARYVLSWTRTVAGTSTSQLFQKMEDVRTFSGKRVTLTFWAAANAPTEIEAYFAQIFGTGGSPSATVNVATKQFSLSGSPTKFTATFDIPSIDGKTLGTNGDDCLWLLFRRLHNAQNPTALVNITLVSVVEGDATTEDDPFSARHPQQELALCQRYFERTQRVSYQYTMQPNSIAILPVPFKVPKRTAPSFTPTFTNNVNTGVPVVGAVYLDGFNVQSTADAQPITAVRLFAHESFTDGEL